MRLHRLEIEGFGPFRERQVVDFDAFADDGIFLIAGRTGAGKSSILDAVCFGLYGGVPRYESGEKRLRSDHSEPGDPSEVMVEFSTSSGRYRVTRSPEYERPAKRGGGMTREAPKVTLDEWTPDGWAGVAARAVDVGTELKDILQLSQEQFLQVILLAQNRFARFLLADSKERQQLLRRLFGTERFEDYQRRFDERRKQSELAVGTRLSAVSAQLDQAEGLASAQELWGDSDDDIDAASVEERLARLERARTRAEYRVEQTTTGRDAAEIAQKRADEELAAVTADREAQRERDRARARLDEIDADRPRIAGLRERLVAARAAEGLRSAIAAVRKAAAAVDAATARVIDRRGEWMLLDASAEIDLTAMPASPDAVAGHADATRLRDFADEQNRARGAWARAGRLEDEQPQRARGVAAAAAAVETAEQVLARIEEERARIPLRLAEVQQERDPLRRDAEQSEARALQVVEAEARFAAAAEVVGWADELTAAERERAASTAALGRAVSSLADLLQRRLNGMAGELATTLVDGEACAVCGATAHPAPASHVDPVTADDIAAAEAERDLRTQAEHAATERLAAVRVSLAAAQERAGGRDVVRAEAEKAAAREAQERTTAAAKRVAELDTEIAVLEARRAEVEADREKAVAALADARHAHALLVDQDALAARDIEEARGSFSTVAERLRTAASHIAAASGLADALDEHAAAAVVDDEAGRELSEELSASSFADVGAVESALMSPAQQDALDEQITDHLAADKKERAILLELELRTLPEEPIDLMPVRAVADAAKTAWQDAVTRATQAEETSRQLTEIVGRASAEHRASARLSAQHDVIDALAQTIAGRGANTYRMNLETFVLAAELEEIVAAANLRLREMSGGRYQLQHTDTRAARGAASGLGIIVFDAFTGQTRPAQSLSGGETFLGSLALALGLAEVVTARAGGIQLDTLFIDEGFGSLDADTLDVAMRTLDELRQGGRTVGVISHVEAMQEQIPAQLTVRTTPDGPSVIDAG